MLIVGDGCGGGDGIGSYGVVVGGDVFFRKT